MNIEEFVVELAACAVSLAFGWVTRGILEDIRRRQRDRAWRRSRHFLASRNSKN
jgi:hypothetical protein